MAASPKVQFKESETVAPLLADLGAVPVLRLRCECGVMALVSPSEGQCPACGAAVVRWSDELAVVGEPVPGNGGIPSEVAERILSDSLTYGWHAAIAACDPAIKRVVCDRRGTSLDDILPLPAGASVLYLNSGWGHAALALSRHYRMIAIERNWTRARIAAMLKRQEGSKNLMLLSGDFDLRRIAGQSFDGIVVSDLGPRIHRRDRAGERSAEETLLFLFQSLRRLLAPSGIIAAVLPNCQARLGGVCRAPWFTDRRLRLLSGNSGHSHAEYRRVFERARLAIACTYVSVCRQDVAELVPLSRSALAYYVGREREWPEGRVPRSLERAKRAVLRQRLFWRLAGPEFIFVLQHRRAADAAMTGGRAAPAA